MSDDKFKYTLIEFTQRGRPSKRRLLEIVPTKWISHNKKSKSLKVRYLKPKAGPQKGYSKDESELLQSFIKTNANLPEDNNESWPEYNFRYKGKAGNIFLN